MTVIQQDTQLEPLLQLLVNASEVDATYHACLQALTAQMDTASGRTTSMAEAGRTMVAPGGATAGDSN